MSKEKATIEKHKINFDEVGRLDKYLSVTYPKWSRTRLQKLINSRFVLVDNHPASPNHMLKIGQMVSVEWPKKPEKKPVSKNLTFPFDIVFEDDELLVVNKPVGMVVHPSAGHRDGNSLVELIAPKISDGNWPDDSRPGLVHRLDRDTSGVIIIARNPESHAHLSKQFAKRTVKKTYLALIHGVMKSNLGTIECFIERDPGKRQRFAIASSGRWASTKFKIIEKFGDIASTIELYPLTGRTHQLRVQLAGYGHFILGDHVYGIPERDFKQFTRQMLHARKIEFIHPLTGKALSLEAPLPEDFQEGIKLLRLSHGD
ncbi:MAG: RluA family pseudouridine synthase [Elusimicrobiota bacterium]